MSVPKYKRLPSEADFVYYARVIEMYIKVKVRKFDKSETFTMKVPLCDLAFDINRNIRRGNSIYPMNQHEAQLRRDFFLTAKGDLEALTGEWEIAKEIVKSLDHEMFFDLSDLLRKELKLLSALMKKDRERYKDLP